MKQYQCIVCYKRIVGHKEVGDNTIRNQRRHYLISSREHLYRSNHGYAHIGCINSYGNGEGDNFHQGGGERNEKKSCDSEKR